MTCIAGLIKDDKVWIGGDSAGSTPSSICIRRDSKVFKIGEFLIGYAGSFRMGQLIRYKLTPPDRNEQRDIFEYMVTDFVESVRTLAKENGICRIEDNVEELPEIQLLIGYKSRLFTLEEDFQIGEVSNDYYAIGSGADWALGSLYTSQKLKTRPRTRILTALEAASTFAPEVSGPFTILSI